MGNQTEMNEQVPNLDAASLMRLIEASGMINASLNIERVLERIVDTAMKIADCEGCSIILQDPITKELVFRKSDNPVLSEAQVRIVLSPGVGVCGAVVQTGQPLLVDDTAADERFFPGVDEQTGVQTRSILALPLLRGHAKTHGKMALVHFDAHTDCYDEEEKYNHGCMFHRAPREGLINPAHSIQVGIRTDYDCATHAYQVINAHQANEQSVAATVAAIRARVGDHPAYLTFDIDCLDPAFAPGTGTPVVGGLSTSRAMRILQGIADLNIVGFDVVEVSPPFDQTGNTALVGATLMFEILCLLAGSRSRVA